MTNEYIMTTALRQSALDCNCMPEDFLKNENTYTVSLRNGRARKYLPLPFACDFVTYGSGVVAQCREDLISVVRDYLEKYPAEHAFETPHIHALDELLRPFELKVCFMAEYFLPDMRRFCEKKCNYLIKDLCKDDLKELYLPQWSNALCEIRKELDMFAVGAYDGGRLIGLAGCSADCQDMYQIGVDVLPEYRGQGIASAITSRLALNIMNLGKVPFYCAAWCNLRSVKNAISSGFMPAWIELTAREISFVEKMNQ